MKTITRLFLVGLIAFGMTACSNEDEIQIEGKAESTVSVKVVPSSNGPTVRSVGDLSGVGVDTTGLAAESEIKTVEVYLFDDVQGGIPAGYKSGTGNEVKDISTTSGPKTIIVVANCSIIGEVSNKSQLLAKTKDLPVNIITDGLPMTGMVEEVVVKAGKNYYGHATSHSMDAGSNHISPNSPLRVTRVNARVAIIGADLALGEGYNIFDALTDVEVAMFNVHETSKLFGESLVTTTTSYLFGEAWPTTGDSYAAGTANAAFKDSVKTFPITAAAAPYYYVNENASTDAKTQMMIILRGKPTKLVDEVVVPVKAEGLYTDGDGFTYYPVWVNGPDYEYNGAENAGDSKIRRNTQYNITLTIKGIGNPSIDPVTNSQLDVIVDVAPWLVVNQNVEWNTPTAP